MSNFSLVRRFLMSNTIRVTIITRLIISDPPFYSIWVRTPAANRGSAF